MRIRHQQELHYSIFPGGSSLKFSVILTTREAFLRRLFSHPQPCFLGIAGSLAGVRRAWLGARSTERWIFSASPSLWPVPAASLCPVPGLYLPPSPSPAASCPPVLGNVPACRVALFLCPALLCRGVGAEDKESSVPRGGFSHRHRRGMGPLLLSCLAGGGSWPPDAGSVGVAVEQRFPSENVSGHARCEGS